MALLRCGDVGPAVSEVRARLHRLGLVQDHAAAYHAPFDGVLERAVRAFQQDRGLRVDGIVGPETFRALDEAHWRLGDRVLYHHVGHPLVGDDVVALQRRLLELGFDAGRVDGVFGARSEQALREFQRNVGLTSDGTCGPKTLRALRGLRRSVVGGSSQSLRDAEALHRAGPTLVGKTVVIDPGHGGPDRGVVAFGLEEADLTADLAARLDARLAAQGVHTLLTHGPHSSPEEAERAAFANAAGADLLLSLHVDGTPSPRCEGVASYHFGNTVGHGSAVGERLAGLVQREIVARTRLLDCRSHPKTWDLLRLTQMPAVRIDVGHLTHPGDAELLGNPAVRDRVAEAILVAVQRHYLPPEMDAPTGMLRLSDLIRV